MIEPATMDRAHRTGWWLSLDLAAVVAFVIVGRDTHDDAGSLAATAEVLAPLVVGLVVAWAVVRTIRSPLAPRTGSATAIVAAVTGLALRRFVVGDGTAVAFVLVTLGFYLVTMIGWRVVVTAIGRSRAAD